MVFPRTMKELFCVVPCEALIISWLGGLFATSSILFAFIIHHTGKRNSNLPQIIHNIVVYFCISFQCFTHRQQHNWVDNIKGKKKLFPFPQSSSVIFICMNKCRLTNKRRRRRILREGERMEMTEREILKKLYFGITSQGRGNFEDFKW